MALMIPDSIPSKASQEERTLYSLLRQRLPDDANGLQIIHGSCHKGVS